MRGVAMFRRSIRNTWTMKTFWWNQFHSSLITSLPSLKTPKNSNADSNSLSQENKVTLNRFTYSKDDDSSDDMFGTPDNFYNRKTPILRQHDDAKTHVEASDEDDDDDRVDDQTLVLSQRNSRGSFANSSSSSMRLSDIGTIITSLESPCVTNRRSEQNSERADSKSETNGNVSSTVTSGIIDSGINSGSVVTVADRPSGELQIEHERDRRNLEQREISDEDRNDLLEVPDVGRSDASPDHLLPKNKKLVVRIKGSDINSAIQKSLEESGQRKSFAGQNTTNTEQISFNKTAGSRKRKLYDPDESFSRRSVVNDESQREISRSLAKKRKSNESVFIPVTRTRAAVSVSDKVRMYLERNNIDIEEVLGKKVDKSNSKKIPQRKNKTECFVVDGDRDEQRELAREILGDRAVLRRSQRLTQIEKRPLKSIDVRPSRRETKTNTEMAAQRSRKRKMPSIVCTMLHREDVVMFGQIVSELGGFAVEDTVTDATTHLVVGEAKRTINVLRALVRGCWILEHEWLLKSSEARKWLPEDDYEEIGFSPTVKLCRLQRQTLGCSFSMNIFEGCGSIYVAKGSSPSRSELQELIGLCNGKITQTIRCASIVIGGFKFQQGIVSVNEKWVLDSIVANKLLSFKKYIIKQRNGVAL